MYKVHGSAQQFASHRYQFSLKNTNFTLLSLATVGKGTQAVLNKLIFKNR